jgi:VanZ family protein
MDLFMAFGYLLRRRSSNESARHLLGLDGGRALPHCRWAPVLLSSGMMRSALWWCPAAAWMAVIFLGSSDTASGERVSGLLGPLLHWLFPGRLPEELAMLIFAARKCAHATEYAILALLVWLALRRPRLGRPQPWSSRPAGLALLFCALYAASDEFHQKFVPTRTASVVDVMIDVAGAGLALLTIRAWCAWRARRAGRGPGP